MTRNPIHRSGLLLMSLLLPLSPLAGQEEAATRELLRDGLYAEEVTRDAEKAAEHYQKVLDLHDQQQPFAATALFRLAEVRRKQDRKEEAIKLYQRLIREFPAAEPELKLARENLTAMGAAMPENQGDPAKPESAEAGRLEFLKNLAKSSPDRLGEPQLFQEAISNNQTECLAFLMDTAGAPENWPLLPWAAERGSLESVILLLKKGVDPNAEGERTALPRAAALGHLHIARALIGGGADVNQSPEQCLIPPNPGSSIYEPIGTPLMEAVATGQGKMIDLLLEAKADVKKPAGGTGYTALHFAAGNDDTGTLKRLLDAGAEPDAVAGKKQSNDGPEGVDGTVSPLDFALQRGSEKAADLIAKAGGRIHNPDLLLDAVIAGEPAEVRKLLLLGADPNGTQKGEPLLFLGNQQKARILLEAGANPNAKSGQMSVLMNAIDQQDWELANLLLDKGADPNPQSDARSRLPLVRAMSFREGFPTVERLIAKGVKPEPGWNRVDFQGGFRRTGDMKANYGPILFRHFDLPGMEDMEEIRWVRHERSKTSVEILLPKTSQAEPPPLAQILLEKEEVKWSIPPNSSRPIRFIIWRKDSAGKRLPIEFGSDDPEFPALKWGDIVEATLRPDDTVTDQPTEQRLEGPAAWLLRGKLSFEVTFEQNGKSQPVRVNGSRMVFDPSRSEVPYVGARGLAILMTGRRWTSRGENDPITIQREGFPEITIPLWASSKDFPLLAGDKVIFKGDPAVDEPDRASEIRLLSPGTPFTSVIFAKVGPSPQERASAVTMPTLFQAVAELDGRNQSSMKGAPSTPDLLGPWMCTKGLIGRIAPVILPHPDLSKITIRRLKEDGGEEAIRVDLSSALEAAGEGMTPEAAHGHDRLLQPGDIVEIPVRDDQVGKPWLGLGDKERLLLSKVLDCQIQYTDPSGKVEIKPFAYRIPRYITLGAQAVPIPPETGTSSFNVSNALGIYDIVKISRDGLPPTEVSSGSAYLRDGLRIEFDNKPRQIPRPPTPRAKEPVSPPAR